MGEEELDLVRAEEARRQWLNNGATVDGYVIAARLARKGWTPPDPLEAEITAFGDLFYRDMGRINFDVAIRKALERGIEIGREQSR